MKSRKNLRSRRRIKSLRHTKKNCRKFGCKICRKTRRMKGG